MRNLASFTLSLLIWGPSSQAFQCASFSHPKPPHHRLSYETARDLEHDLAVVVRLLLTLDGTGKSVSALAPSPVAPYSRLIDIFDPTSIALSEAVWKFKPEQEKAFVDIIYAQYIHFLDPLKNGRRHMHFGEAQSVKGSSISFKSKTIEQMLTHGVRLELRSFIEANLYAIIENARRIKLFTYPKGNDILVTDFQSRIRETDFQ